MHGIIVGNNSHNATHAYTALKSVSIDLYIVLRYLVDTRKVHALVDNETSTRIQIF
jgi:hypothetical protein